MAYWAKVKSENGKHMVTQVIVCEKSDLANQISEEPGSWIETYPDANGKPDKRYNYASVGTIWDPTGDFFYTPSEYPSWKLDSKKIMQPPVVQGTKADSPYTWNETNGAWE